MLCCQPLVKAEILEESLGLESTFRSVCDIIFMVRCFESGMLSSYYRLLFSLGYHAGDLNFKKKKKKEKKNTQK